MKQPYLTLEHSNFDQTLPCQNSSSLDVLLMQDKERIEYSATDKQLEEFYSLSDHHHFKTIIGTNLHKCVTTAKFFFVFNKQTGILSTSLLPKMISTTTAIVMLMNSSASGMSEYAR